MRYAEVILPVPIGVSFTYAVSTATSDSVKVGCRVVVPFGRNKLHTGIVRSLHNEANADGYEIKEISEVVDTEPVVGEKELRLWEWMADYYMCALGDVMKAALPSGIKLASETQIQLIEEFADWDSLTKTESAAMDILVDGKHKTVADLQKAAGSMNAIRVVRSLMQKGALQVSETLIDSFKPKKEVHVRLSDKFLDETAINELFDSLQKTPRRYSLVLKLAELASAESAIRLHNPQMMEEVSRARLLKEANVSAAVLNALKAKGIVELYDYEVGRLHNVGGSVKEQLPLSEAQQEAFDKINEEWKDKRVCLLHGVTSSGKTEIYIRLIKQTIAQGKQVLYLLPEIALTTQITQRLQRIFGDDMGVYHSKFPDAERVEIWQKQMGAHPFKLIVGVRSALFLPQQNVGLIIVDEEHETSYKQQDPAPRYNARDAAVMLAYIHDARVLLGTATPSVETYYNASMGKYGYVRLDRRYGDMLLPDIEVADIQDLLRRKMMKLPFSPRLEEEMKQALDNGEQVILFQNRRGYAPVVECDTCGWVPTCEYCDVSLTYHHDDNRLHCHYCGNTFPLPAKCPNCGGFNLKSFGFGTEKIEEEVSKRFPGVRTARLDLDTTRSRSSYRKIIDAFSEGKTDVLIGTQMISKGLDFGNVRVVGILDADTMLNRPDFRCHERAFQMMSQVAGRAGRRNSRGLVILQTRRADSRLISQVVHGDFHTMFQEQLKERQRFYYPPFYRLIYVWIKHRDESVAMEAARLAAVEMQKAFGGGVLGPDKPAVARVQMQHIRKVALKVAPHLSAAEVRAKLRTITDKIMSVTRLRSVTIFFDVDPQ
ncbi:MAG: primosomal protein N' [Bacteroidaceae bacterium]|nr:primosomal protein N' [Bacteroidaceae bacterium]